MVEYALRHKAVRLSLYFQKNKRHPEKEGTLKCYISVSGHRRIDVSTGIKLFREQWNPDTKKITGKSSSRLNEATAIFLQNTRNIADELRLRNKLHPMAIKNAIQHGFHKDYSMQMLFEDFVQEKIEFRKIAPEKLSEASVRKYRDYQRYLFEYLHAIQNPDMQLSEANRDFGLKYFDWLRYGRTPKLANNTAVKVVHALSAMMNYAVGKELIKVNKIKDLGLKKEQKTEFIYLTDKELYRLETHGFIDAHLQLCADMYILQCHTGMAYTDLANFDYKKSVHTLEDSDIEYIQANRGKTGREFIVPLTRKARHILTKYDNDVPKFWHMNKLRVMSMKSYNENLKEIARLLGFEKNITSHTARCTAGMRFYNLDYTERQIEAMMGASMKVLKQHYAKTNAKTVCRAFIQNEMSYASSPL